MRADGRRRRLVLPGVATIWGKDIHLRWAPGRPLIAVTSGGRFIVDVAHSRRWRLHLPQDVRGEPSWSPNGQDERAFLTWAVLGSNQ